MARLSNKSKRRDFWEDKKFQSNKWVSIYIIDFSKKKNYKAFHVTKNGKNTGVFSNIAESNDRNIVPNYSNPKNINIGNIVNNEQAIKINLFKTKKFMKDNQSDRNLEGNSINDEIMEDEK